MRKPSNEKQEINKGAWSKQEDQILIDYIHEHGEGCWRTLPKSAGLLRCGKSCRLRWINYLRPNLKRGNFGEDEDDLIIKLHALLGNRWSLIAGRLPGRTDNEIKNYWNSHLRRKLIKMGVDPNNHRLCHTHPRPNLDGAISSTVENSSILANPTAIPYRDIRDRREASDVGSCLHDRSLALPDLNLNLSITIANQASSNGDIFNNNVEYSSEDK